MCLRICYYNRLLNEPWGCGVHARKLVDSWRAQGHDVLCLPADLASPSEQAKSSVRSLDLVPRFARPPAHELSARLRAARDASNLASIVCGFAPEVLVTRRAGYDYCLDEVLRRCATPYVAEVNAVICREIPQLTGERVPPWERRREIRYLVRAAGAVCVTEELRSQLHGIGISADRLAVLPNGVDTSEFSPNTRANPQTAEWAGGFRLVFCYAGTLSYTHDSGGLLAVAGKLAATALGVGFLFVGPTREELASEGTWSAALGDRCRCTGRVPHSAVPSHMVCADVFWASFRNDYGSPLKLYEYMAMAKPVILAGAGEAVEVVRSSRCGYFVARGDDCGLLELAHQLESASAEQRHELGTNARVWVGDGHTWSDVSGRFLQEAVAMVGRSRTA